MTLVELFKTWTKEEATMALASMSVRRRHEMICALAQAGLTPRELVDAGWTLRDLVKAGWTPRALVDAGWTPRALVRAGRTLRELVDAGWTLRDLEDAGLTPRELVDAGWTLRDLVDAGWTPRELVDAGLTPRELLKAGWTPRNLVTAGWTPRDLVKAGWPPREAGVSEKEFEIFLGACESDVKAKTKRMGRVEAEYVADVLRRGLMSGKDYGTVNSCGCFLGTAARKAGVSVDDFCRLRGIVKDAASPAEEWFMSVVPGDTPENSYTVRMGLKWIEEELAAT